MSTVPHKKHVQKWKHEFVHDMSKLKKENQILFVIGLILFVMQSKNECAGVHERQHGTIIRTGVTFKKIQLQKSTEFSMAVK